VSDYKNKTLIAERVLLLGENDIPREILDHLTDEHLQMFLREPDPSLWPHEMEPLVHFLSDEERLKLDVQSTCSEHEAELREPLQRWTLSVWDRLDDRKSPNAHVIIDEMAGYLKTLMTAFLGERIPRRPDSGE